MTRRIVDGHPAGTNYNDRFSRSPNPVMGHKVTAGAACVCGHSLDEHDCDRTPVVGLSGRTLVRAGGVGCLGENCACDEFAACQLGDPCIKECPDPGHEDEGYGCATHNMPWGECAD